jgi:hypothetical protein
MKPAGQMAAIVLAALAGAGGTYLVHGPPARGVVCDAAKLKPDEVCLARVMGEWRNDVIWVDARPRKEWREQSVAGSVLWNLDQQEDMQAFEAAGAMRMVDGRRVVVFCTNEDCGTSRQVSDRIRSLQLGNEVFVLFGGWRALATAGAQGPALGPNP